MFYKNLMMTACVAALLPATTASAADFLLITGVDALLNPGSARLVIPVPGPGFPGELSDGDRLAGTSNIGDVVLFGGIGTPMFDPNEFGALSFAFRRGSIPVPPNNFIPIMAVDFLGGPLLDLDGDLDNGSRSLVPLFDVTAIAIPNTWSMIGLTADFESSSIALDFMDMTSTNPGAPGIQAEIATTINVLAGTANDGTLGDPINPSVDTRTGTLTPFTGTSGLLRGVYRIDNLGFEMWQDSIDQASSSASVLGTHQFLGTLRGWLVVRDPETGAFPQLTGEGLGTTLWPLVDVSLSGQTFDTANGLQGGSATISLGPAADRFDVCGTPPGNCNGGVAYEDNDGDLGAYFDQVIAPLLGENDYSYVYLESAGAGINNSFDPVFGDTVSWDVVIAAASPCGVLPEPISGDVNGDFTVNIDDYELFVDCVSGPGGGVPEGCFLADIDEDDDVDLIDFGGLQASFGTTAVIPDCLLEES